MYVIEKMSNKIGSKISKDLKLDNDNKEILSYGAFILLQMLWCILWVVVFGIIFDVLPQTLVITFCIATLRKFSGGVHANSPNKCAIIGMIISTLLALFVKKVLCCMFFYMVVFWGILVLIYSYYILNTLAPVDSPAKPINDPKERDNLKKNSILTVGFFLVAVIVLLSIYQKTNNPFYLNMINCIYVGIIWQCFTLTPLAHFLLKKI